MKNLILFVVPVFLLISCKSTTDDMQENQEHWQFSYKNMQTIQYRTDIAIQDANLVSYDVYFDDESEDLRPVVIWIHGGGWAVGDKANNFEAKKDYFESLGYVLVSVNYRLSPVNEDGEPNDLLNENRIKFPTHPNDVASAINTIYHEIHNFKGDKHNMVIMGHSAGAHISMLVATDPQYLGAYNLNPKDVFKGIANFDTEAYDINQDFLDYGITANNDIIDLEITNYMDSDVNTIYHRTVITYLNAFGKNSVDWFEASPINHLNHTNKPTKYFIYYQDEATSNENRVDLIEGFISVLENDSSNEVFARETPFEHEIINNRIGLDNTMTTNLTDFLEDCFN